LARNGCGQTCVQKRCTCPYVSLTCKYAHLRAHPFCGAAHASIHTYAPTHFAGPPMQVHTPSCPPILRGRPCKYTHLRAHPFSGAAHASIHTFAPTHFAGPPMGASLHFAHARASLAQEKCVGTRAVQPLAYQPRVLWGPMLQPSDCLKGVRLAVPTMATLGG